MDTWKEASYVFETLEFVKRHVVGRLGEACRLTALASDLRQGFELNNGSLQSGWPLMQRGGVRVQLLQDLHERSMLVMLKAEAFEVATTSAKGSVVRSGVWEKAKS